MALRVAVIGAGDNGGVFLDSLSTFTSLFQHGNRPLNYLTEKNYAKVLLSDISKTFSCRD